MESAKKASILNTALRIKRDEERLVREVEGIDDAELDADVGREVRDIATRAKAADQARRS